MVEIRVLGQNRDQVEAWYRLALKLASEQAGSSEVRCRPVLEGRKGEFLGYVRLHPEGEQIAAPRLPRKGSLSNVRYRRSRR